MEYKKVLLKWWSKVQSKFSRIDIDIPRKQQFIVCLVMIALGIIVGILITNQSEFFQEEYPIEGTWNYQGIATIEIKAGTNQILINALGNMYSGQITKTSLNNFIINIPQLNLNYIKAQIISKNQARLEDGTVFIKM